MLKFCWQYEFCCVSLKCSLQILTALCYLCRLCSLTHKPALTVEYCLNWMLVLVLATGGRAWLVEGDQWRVAVFAAADPWHDLRTGRHVYYRHRFRNHDSTRDQVRSCIHLGTYSGSFNYFLWVCQLLKCPLGLPRRELFFSFHAL